MSAMTIAQVQKGDVIRFKTYALRVEADPICKGSRVLLEGRENRGSCSRVRRWYFSNFPLVAIERDEATR